MIVFNPFGEEVYYTQLNTKQEETIDLSGMKSGVYSIKVVSGNNVWVEKLIKQ